MITRVILINSIWFIAKNCDDWQKFSCDSLKNCLHMDKSLLSLTWLITIQAQFPKSFKMFHQILSFIQRYTCSVYSQGYFCPVLTPFYTCNLLLIVFYSPRFSCDKRDVIWDIGIHPLWNSPADNKGKRDKIDSGSKISLNSVYMY